MSKQTNRKNSAQPEQKIKLAKAAKKPAVECPSCGKSLAATTNMRLHLGFHCDRMKQLAQKNRDQAAEFLNHWEKETSRATTVYPCGCVLWDDLCSKVINHADLERKVTEYRLPTNRPSKIYRY